MTLEDENYTVNMEPFHSFTYNNVWGHFTLVLVILMCISMSIH